MDYIKRVKEEFWDLNMFQAWDIVDRRVTKAHIGDNEYITLHHPCNMKRELLKELIPPSYDIDEIIELVNIKQKQIARRLNISKLPSDRPSGMLGQSALFEVLRDKGFDFKSYVDGWPHKWFHSQAYGYMLLMLYGYLTYIRRFFAQPPIDLVKYMIEPITDYQFAMTWDDSWVQRVLHNVIPVTPNYLPNKYIHTILSKLMCVQDGWGATVSRVMEWTGLSRSEATHIRNVIRTGWCEHRWRLVSKNAGTVKVLRKSQSKWKEVPSFFTVCTSLEDDEDYFISVTDVFKANADTKYYDWEGFNTNIELFDLKDNVWKLNPNQYSAKSVDDIFALIQNGAHTLPDNNMPPTNRDLFFIALMLAMNTSNHIKKREETIDWLTNGYGIPKKDAEQGFRNVMRKNLLRNQHTHYAIMGPEREMLTILFDDKSEKVIPFLGDILPSLPLFWLQMDTKMSYGHLFEHHPDYLSSEVRNLIDTTMKEYDVNCEIFLNKSWAFGFPGSILRLVKDES
ncbi:MAG: hypothetical protein ACFFF4_04240 [Candidatus Thorarchaeota archaeon]